MKNLTSGRTSAILSVALILAIILLMAIMTVKWLDSPFRAGAGNPAKMGPAVLFQPDESVVQAEFSNEIRIVIIPPKHCITYEPKNAVEVVSKAERSIKIRVQQKAMITFRKIPLSDPRCQA